MITRIANTAIALGLCVFATGCGDSPEKRAAQGNAVAESKAQPSLPVLTEEGGGSPSNAAKAWAKRMLVTTNPRENISNRLLKNKGDSRVDDAYSAWMNALQEKSGDKAGGINFVMFFHSVGPMFDNDLFQPERSDKYVRRIKSLPTDAITAWQELVNQVAENQFDKNTTICNLIQIDRLFREVEFNRAEFDLLKARAKAPLADSAKTLSETLALGTKREQAFVELLTEDWLYRRDGSFNQGVFREALEYVRVQQK